MLQKNEVINFKENVRFCSYIYGGDDQSFILQTLYNFCVALGEVSCEIDTRPLVPLSNLEQSRRYSHINHFLLCCRFYREWCRPKIGVQCSNTIQLFKSKFELINFGVDLRPGKCNPSPQSLNFLHFPFPKCHNLFVPGIRSPKNYGI